MKKKIALGLVALVAVAGGVAGMSAFEAHVINVTAKIENALRVDTTPIDFGTVFPQEKLDKELDVTLSASFLAEDRVDDVEYMIRQKPKCGWTTNDGQEGPFGQTQTGEVVVVGDVEEQTTRIVCPDPVEKEPPVEGASWGQLPLLCPYLSKHEITEDGSETNNDRDVAAFHQPWVIDPVLGVVWTEAKGRLSKIAKDTLDTWNIDLRVPCFGNHCAQDWAQFVADNDGDNNADPDDYVQDIRNQHKIFGCDLWIEVLGVSLAKPCIPGTFTVVSDTTNTVQGDGNAEALSFIHPEWTALIPGATWIWENDPVQTPGVDETYTFKKQFNVSGASVTTASLMIATDNTYSVKVNGVPTCSSADEDNFHEATKDVCPVTNLVAGANTLEVTVKNIGIPGSTPTTNPGGLLYKLTYTTVCDVLGCNKKADMMLVLDRSGSIDDAEEALMKTGATAFVDALVPSTLGVHMGQSSFGTTGSLDQVLTDSGVAVKAAIAAITTPGSSLTNLFEGIKKAKEELGGGNDRADIDSPDFMVIITDGNPNQPPDVANARAVALAEATAAKAAGITIFVVGIGSDVDATYLKTIASGDDHYFAADFATLEAVLKALTVCPS